METIGSTLEFGFCCPQASRGGWVQERNALKLMLRKLLKCSRLVCLQSLDQHASEKPGV